MKVVIVTHSTIAESFKNAAEMILGPQENIFSVNFYPDDGPDELLCRISETVGPNVDEDVLFLTDIPGGTPANMCFMFAKNHKAEVITGVNLAMVLELFTSASSGLANSINLAIKSGRSSIKQYVYEGDD